MPLRIAIDVRHIKDFGIGTYIRNLLLALAEVDSANEYFLTALEETKHEFAALPPNFHTQVYPRSDLERLDNIAYPVYLKKLSPDLTHIPLARVPLLMPKPYVVTIHDMSSLLFSDAKGIREDWRMFRFRRALQSAACVIAVSAATRRDVENVMGISSKRIRQVYSAPDPKFLDQQAPAAARVGGPNAWEKEQRRMLERYNISYPFILYAGRIRPHKNLPRLIEAFAVVRGELEHHPAYADLRLIIIGDEISKHPEVRRSVIQSRVENSVRFLGFVPFDTLKLFYSAASAFVFPSLYEGFGLPPLEAMATGTPVVCSNVSSLPEVVADAAMIVNPENVFDMARGIREVLLDESTRQRLIAGGYERVRQFSWRRTAEQVLHIYSEVASRTT